MAHSENLTISTTGNTQMAVRCVIEITDNAGANQSTVKVTLQARKTGGIASQGNLTGNLTIGGTNYALSGNKTVPVSESWTSLQSASKVYTHNSLGVIGANVTGVGVSGAYLIGTSAWDTGVSGSTTLEVANFTDYSRVPSAPAKPTFTLISATSARVNWVKPTSSLTINDYDMDYGTASNLSTHTDTNPGVALFYDITGLTRNTKYYARVRAWNADGWSAFSPIGDFTTLHTKPDKPVAPSITNLTATTAKIDITDPAYVGASVTQRETQIRQGTTVVQTFSTVDPTATGLTRGASYTARYRVKNAIDWSDWSNDASFTTPGTPPSAPTNYTVYDIASTSAKVTLGTLSDNGGATPTQVRVKVSTTASDAGLVGTFSEQQWAPIRLSGLNEGTVYYVSEAAFNTVAGGGWGPYGSWSSFTTKNTVPNAPVLSLDSASGTTATLKWVEPTDLNGSTIQEYKLLVARNKSLTQSPQEYTLDSDQLVRVVSGLSEGTTYYASVWTVSSAGLGSSSPVLSFATTGGGGSGSGVWIDVGGVPKFAEVWIDVAGVPKLCEVWIDVAGVPKLATA